MADSVVSPRMGDRDADVEASVRPKTFGEFVGKEDIKERLHIYITAAKERKEPVDHILLSGPLLSNQTIPLPQPGK